MKPSTKDEILKLIGIGSPLDPLHYVLGADINTTLSKGNRHLVRALFYAAWLSVLNKWIDDGQTTALEHRSLEQLHCITLYPAAQDAVTL